MQPKEHIGVDLDLLPLPIPESRYHRRGGQGSWVLTGVEAANNPLLRTERSPDGSAETPQTTSAGRLSVLPRRLLSAAQRLPVSARWRCRCGDEDVGLCWEGSSHPRQALARGSGGSGRRCGGREKQSCARVRGDAGEERWAAVFSR
jgi:hypothetical protein